MASLCGIELKTEGDTHERSATEEAPKVSFLVLIIPNCGENHFNHQHCNLYSHYSSSLRVGHTHHGPNKSMECIQVPLLDMPSYLLHYHHYGSYCLKTDQSLSLP